MKSSFTNNECVDVERVVAPVDGVDTEMFIVTDTKDPDGEPLNFNRKEWNAFLKGVKAGEFDFNGDQSEAAEVAPERQWTEDSFPS